MRSGVPSAAAAWMRYLLGVDEAGASYVLNDPMAATLRNLAMVHASDAQATVLALGTLEPIWGVNLVADLPWLANVNRELRRINQRGILNALIELNTEIDTELDTKLGGAQSL